MQVSTAHTGANVSFNAAHNVMRTFLNDQVLRDMKADSTQKNPFDLSYFVKPLDYSNGNNNTDQDQNLDQAVFDLAAEQKRRDEEGSNLELVA